MVEIKILKFLIRENLSCFISFFWNILYAYQAAFVEWGHNCFSFLRVINVEKKAKKNIVFWMELEPTPFFEQKHTWGMLPWNYLKSFLSWCCCTSSSLLFQVLLHKHFSFLVLHKILSSWCYCTPFSPNCAWCIITTYFFAGLSSWPCCVVLLKR